MSAQPKPLAALALPTRAMPADECEGEWLCLHVAEFLRTFHKALQVRALSLDGVRGLVGMAASDDDLPEDDAALDRLFHRLVKVCTTSPGNLMGKLCNHAFFKMHVLNAGCA